MSLFSTEADALYLENKPPLLIESGISTIGSNSKVYGATTIYEGVLFDSIFLGLPVKFNNLDSSYDIYCGDFDVATGQVKANAATVAMHAASSCLTLPATISVQPFWNLRFTPYINGNTSEITTETEKSFTSSVTDLQSAGSTLGCSLSASAGFSFGGFNTSVSASLNSSISSSVSYQQAVEQSVIETESFTLPGQTTVAVWDKRTMIRIEFPGEYIFLKGKAVELPPEIQYLQDNPDYYHGYLMPQSEDAANMEAGVIPDLTAAINTQVEVVTIQSYIDTCSLANLPN